MHELTEKVGAVLLLFHKHKDNLPPYAGAVIERCLERNDGRTVLATLVLSWTGEAIEIGDLRKPALREDGRPCLKITPQDRMLGTRVRIKLPDGRLRCCHAGSSALHPIELDQPRLLAPK